MMKFMCTQSIMKTNMILKTHYSSMSTDTHYSSTTTSFEIENEAFYIEEDAILPNKSLASNKNSKPSDTCKNAS